jgi:hypothetical protein
MLGRGLQQGERAGGHASFVAAAAHMAALQPGRVGTPIRPEQRIYLRTRSIAEVPGTARSTSVRGGTAMMSRLRRVAH